MNDELVIHDDNDARRVIGLLWHAGYIHLANRFMQELERGGRQALQQLNEWVQEFDVREALLALEPPQEVLDERARLAGRPWQLDRPIHELVRDPDVDFEALSTASTATTASLSNLLGMSNNNNDAQPGDKRPRTDGGTTTTLRMTGEGSGLNRETPIDPHPPSYQLQDTHTTVMPITFYFSVTCQQPYSTATAWDIPTTVQFRMNSLYDTLSTSLTALDTTTTNLTTTRYVGNKFIVEGGSTVGNNLLSNFPSAVTSGGPTTETPYMRAFWQKLYQYYTVMGAKWKLTTSSLENTNSEMALLHTYHGTTTPTPAPYDQMRYYKKMNEQILHCQKYADFNSSRGQYTYTSGTYKPGDFKREIIDDTKANTWTAFGSAPTYTEYLSLFFFPAPLSQKQAVNATSGASARNCRLDIQFLVQMKDLVTAFKYPATGTTNVALNSTDIYQLI